MKLTLLLATSAAFLGVASALPTDTEEVAPNGIGKVTWFYPGLGACGKRHTQNDMVAALNSQEFDRYGPRNDPSKNPRCGNILRVTYGGKSVDVTIVDRCEGCVRGGINLSPAAFGKLANLDVGVIYADWRWIKWD
ncbi:hypothetical protein VTJ04DRAFT_5806 [Mycothermus thermophilus]|uniref:uncharacterized protein n=1 Tax=Humicola insolens TaxID=85995 RepID=UPI0037436A93